jgi:tetratricopeptide (TPR) repeat protein
MTFEFKLPQTEEELALVHSGIRKLAKQGKYTEALAVCDMLIRNSSTRISGFRERAAVYERMDDIPSAIEDLKIVIANEDPEPADLYQLGMLVLHWGKASEAISYFSKAIEMGDQNKFHYYNNSSYLHRADAYLRLGDLEQAEADCAKLPSDCKDYIYGVGMRSKQDILEEIAKRKPKVS